VKTRLLILSHPKKQMDRRRVQQHYFFDWFNFGGGEEQ
jgi:hypothetical protein